MVTFNERTLDFAERRVYPDDRAAYIEMLDSDALFAKYYRGERNLTMEFREQRPDNTLRWLRLTVELIEYPDSSDIAAYLLYEDIDAEKREELEIIRRAETDSLTGVYNRAAFTAKAQELICGSQRGKQHAFMLLDVDGFKRINDLQGHMAGDEALKDIASVIQSVLRHGDLLGRIGGDEFMLCLVDVPYNAVIEKRAHQLCALLRKTFSGGVKVSVSIGIAVYPSGGESFEELYRHSDAAMYVAKQSGKDGFTFYAPGMETTESITEIDYQEEDAEASAPKRRMLIVDDSSTNRIILSAIFKEDFITDEAEDGESALVHLRRYGSSVSIVLLDLAMPGMDGFTVLARMRESVDLQSIPVIVVSGSDTHETMLKTIKLGASDFVTKPIDPVLVRLRVQAALSKAENERLRAQNSYLILQSDEEERYRTVLKSTGTVVIDYDWVNGVFVYDPAAGEHIAANFDGRPLWQALEQDGAADAATAVSIMELLQSVAHSSRADRSSLNVILKTPSGGKRWFNMHVFKQTDESRIANKMIITFNDVNDEVIAERKLRFRAERDELTGLYNRRTFIALAGDLISRGAPNAYVLSVCDIDNFKIVNDLYGHDEGDALIKHMGTAIKNQMNAVGGLCCRLNADVFAYLQKYDSEQVEDVAKELRKRLAEYDISIELSESMGRCIIDDPELPVDSIIDRAALASKTIKGRYDQHEAWYDAKLREQLLREQEIVGSMETALAQGQFDIYLQAQFDNATNEIVGAEALVRWQHPEKGMISPGDFIPIFERNGFISKMDEYVWNLTAKTLHERLERGLKAVPVSVNVSRLDVYDPTLSDRIADIIKRYDIPRELFRLEITESAFVDDPRQLIETVNKLHALGFIIEMDDFGSGYSSLNTLKEVPIDIIKMDMRFISDEGDMERGGVILNSVVRMTKWLGIPVIAEGVETQSQADFLRSIGCTVVQGFLYARPLPVAEFDALLDKHSVAEGTETKTMATELDTKAFWNPDSLDSKFFNDYIGPAAIYEVRKDGIERIRTNSQFLAALDTNQDELERNSRTPFDRMPPEDKDRQLKAIDRVIATGESENVITHFIPESGVLIKLRSTIRLLARGVDRSIILVFVEELGDSSAAKD